MGKALKSMDYTGPSTPWIQIPQGEAMRIEQRFINPTKSRNHQRTNASTQNHYRLEWLGRYALAFEFADALTFFCLLERFPKF